MAEAWTYHPTWSFLLIIMVIYSLASASTLVEAQPKMWVRIVNDLPGALQLHCQSADNDLHPQVLLPGQQFYFDFGMNFWGTTDFWCQFNYGSKWQHFDVWKGPGIFGRGFVRCHQCLWVVKSEGFYCTQEGLGMVPQLVFPW